MTVKPPFPDIFTCVERRYRARVPLDEKQMQNLS